MLVHLKGLLRALQISCLRLWVFFKDQGIIAVSRLQVEFLVLSKSRL